MKRAILRLTAEEFGRSCLNLGRADENIAVRVEIDLSRILAQEPTATAHITVESPSGAKYPASTVLDGTKLIWDVSDADTAAEGTGCAQLTVKGPNGEVLKSAVAATRIGHSIRGEGPAPDPVQNWVDDAAGKLGAVVAAGEAAETAAGKAETAAERANAAADKAEGSAGLPAGEAPYQQLVTDADGNTAWEDMLVYAVDAFEPVTWNGTTEGREVINGHELNEQIPEGYTYYKIADVTKELASNLNGATMKIHVPPELAELYSSRGPLYPQEATIENFDVVDDNAYITYKGISKAPFLIATYETLYGLLADQETVNTDKSNEIAFTGTLHLEKLECKVPGRQLPVEYVDGLDGVPEMAQEAFTAAGTAQSTAENALRSAGEAKSAAIAAESTAGTAKSTAETAQTTAKSAVQPYKDSATEACTYYMRNPYNNKKPVSLFIGADGGAALVVDVNKSTTPSVKVQMPVYFSDQADLEFIRASTSYPYPRIVGIRGIVMASSTANSTKKFLITVDDSGTLSATEVTETT